MNDWVADQKVLNRLKSPPHTGWCKHSWGIILSASAKKTRKHFQRYTDKRKRKYIGWCEAEKVQTLLCWITKVSTLWSLSYSKNWTCRNLSIFLLYFMVFETFPFFFILSSKICFLFFTVGASPQSIIFLPSD